jgi:hypothetical protein
MTKNELSGVYCTCPWIGTNLSDKLIVFSEWNMVPPENNIRPITTAHVGTSVSAFNVVGHI